MLDRVVVHVCQVVRPGGGAPGYLYNLSKGLEDIAPEAPIRIVSGGSSGLRSAGGSRVSMPHRWRGAMNSWRAMAGWRSVLGVWKSWWTPYSLQVPAVRSAAVVVFHHVLLAHQYLRTCGRISGQKILVMPHSPVLWADELVDAWAEENGGSGIPLERLRRAWRRREIETYAMTDGVLTASEESLSAYAADDPSLVRRMRALRKFVVPTGVIGFGERPEGERLVTRTRLGARSGQLVVGYFGRYHVHKGFDLFLGLIERARSESNQTFRFVSAGAGAIAAPEADNYVNLGWLSSGLPEVMGAVDVVVAPNRVTYFDLGILEAMSLGRVVVTTMTGGNAVLARQTGGIVAVPELTVEAIYDALKNVGGALAGGRENRALFERFYSVRPFVRRHASFAEEILRECAASKSN